MKQGWQDKKVHKQEIIVFIIHPYACITLQNGGVTDTLMRRIHPLLRNCRDNAKLACHCKIECIYMRTKVRGPDSLDLDVEMGKKEERNLDKWLFY